jgi:hypothetical protein
MLEQVTLNEENIEVEYVEPCTPSEQERFVWRSCCFKVDKQFAHFLVQTLVGVALLLFCAIQLNTEEDCERSAPYWGLIGTLCGFFFRKATAPSKNR